MPLTTDEEIELLELEIALAEQEAPAKAPVADEGLDLQDVRGAGQAVLSGMTASFADEIVGGARAGLDKLLPKTEADRLAEELALEGGQSLPQAYAMYRDDARASAREFQEENPGTALGLEVGGAILSPLNKVAPGLGTTGSAGARLGGSILRGGAEGALYGLGAGEGDLEDQLASAAEGALYGGGAAGLLTGVGGGLGRALSKRRVDESLTDAAGNFKPVHMADHEGTIGKVYRNIVGGAFGGRGALGRQESRYLNKAANLARFADEGKPLVKDAVGTGNEVNRVLGSIDDTKRIAQDTARREAKVLRQAAKNADTDDIAALNQEALRRSVPEGYADEITDIGTAGQQQAEAAINKAYDDAWGGYTVGATGRLDSAFAPVRGTLKKRELAQINPVLGDIDATKSAQLVDRELRELLGGKSSNAMSKAVKKLRDSLRSGLPKANKELLEKTDKVYPNYLATLNASTSAGARKRLGAFTAQELAAGATQATGRRGAGVGKSDLLEYTKPILAKTVAKKEAAQKAASRATNRGRRAEQVARASKNRVKRASEGLLDEKATAWSQIASTLALGGFFGAPGVAGGALAARGLATPTAQRAIVGQLPMQEALAKALREGDTAKYQRILARITAQQGTGE